MHTLLLADDNITIQRVVTLTFAQEAFRVVTVTNGQEAIDCITAQPPDIVLAGTTIPNVSGYEVARFVRSQPSLQNVPVLLLTGAFESVDPARLAASGASGILEKPLEPTIVISRVKELLGIQRLMTSAGTGPEKKQPAPREAPPSSEAGGEDYLDTLDAAFDSLDQHLAGRRDERQGRNPSPPLAHHGTAVDPRSPNRRPQPPVPPAAPPANPIFEVDDEWFAEDKKTKEDRRADQKQLAAEMGMHDLELPETPDAVNTAAPAADLDFDFGLDDEPKPTMAATPPSAPASEGRGVADDFAALLAFEQGEHPHPLVASHPAPATPVVVHAPAPEITAAMLDQIAARVADHLRDAMATTVRDTVRSVVSETSERLVRDEISRIRDKAERP